MRKKIWAMAPPHTFRGIPCGGGLSEFWEWPHEGVSEVVNDLDQSLANLWRVWQGPAAFAEFQRQVEAIPVSRPHWQESLGETSENNVERAVQFFVKIRQSMMGLGKTWAPLSKARTRRGMNEQASAWLTAIEGLPEVHERLKGVVIESVDVLDFLRRYDCQNALFFIDPPYFPDRKTDEQQAAALQRLFRACGKANS